MPSPPPVTPVPEAPHQPVAGAPSLSDFACSQPKQVLALLCELRDTAGPVVLSAPDGSAVRGSLWTVDAAMRRLSFDVEAADMALPALVGGNECTAVAYLHQVKLQFDLENLMLVRGRRGTALQATLPDLLYRFQRRQAYRVAALERPAALAELRHPAMPEMRLQLRLLDLSAGGCALQLPPDVPPLPMGVLLEGVWLQLDSATRLPVTLKLLHATSVGAQADGLRLGCELVAPTASLSQQLQRYVDQLQRHRRLLAVD